MKKSQKKSLFIILITIGTSPVNSKQVKIRDPFFLPAPEQSDRIEHKEPSLQLVGIVTSGTKIGALIKNHKRVGVVFSGNLFDGYTVEKIAENTVVLVKGKKSKTLMIE